jgi:putative membrane protein
VNSTEQDNSATPTTTWKQKLRWGWDAATGVERRLTPADLDAITCAVAEAEKGTSGEVVVAIRRCSGNYRDVDYLCGALLAFAALLVALFAPWDVHEAYLSFEVPILFVVGAWVSAMTPLRRWLTSSARRARQVQDAAAAAFVEEGVLLTSGRTGVLVYWSLLERRIHVLADVAVMAAVPADEWNALLFQVKKAVLNPHPVTPLVAELNALGQMLSRYLPAAACNPDELPNQPRMLS